MKYYLFYTIAVIAIITGLYFFVAKPQESKPLTNNVAETNAVEGTTAQAPEKIEKEPPLFSTKSRIKRAAELHKNNGVKTVTVNKYNYKKGKLDKKTETTYATQRYDKNGFLVEETKHDQYDKYAQFKETYTYTYNKDGRKTGYTISGFGNDIKLRATYNYSPNEVEEVVYNEEDFYLKKTVSKLNENWDIVESKNYDSADIFREINRSEYEYNEDGALINAVNYNKHGGKVNNLRVTVEGGKHSTFNLFSLEEKYIASKVKTFDESGNVVKAIEYDNNKKALKYEQFTYHENGLPNERIIYDAEKSDILKHPIANYTYSYKYY